MPTESPDRPVEADRTVNDKRRDAPLPPGPPDADDIDFRRPGEHRSPGYSSPPGAGPNPTASV
ncbi:MAG: hypothetical protein QM803_18745 [Rhodocyclaceae bacterium]